MKILDVRFLHQMKKTTILLSYLNLLSFQLNWKHIKITINFLPLVKAFTFPSGEYIANLTFGVISENSILNKILSNYKIQILTMNLK